MYVYPDTLILKIKEVWPKQIILDEDIPELPNDKILAHLIDVAYHASFLTEENRKIGFRLMYCSKKKLKSYFSSVKGKRDEPIIEFIESRDFNVSEILRLAPATDFTSIIICVGPVSTEGKDHNNTLRIWSLLDSGSSWWDFIHGDCPCGQPPPNFLTIASSQPGHLSISRGGLSLLTMRQGEVLQPLGSIFYAGPIAKRLFQPIKLIYEEAYKNLKVEEFEDTGSHFEFPRQEYLKYIERILFNIREKRHGGTLIIVPDHLQVSDSRLSDRIQIKYPIKYNSGWKLILEIISKSLEYNELESHLFEGQQNISKEEAIKYRMLYTKMEEIERSISDSVRFIASLSGVDGAVVITDHFRVLGFGAEVTAISPTLKEIKISHNNKGDTGHMIQMDTFGTRHRSAFRICSNYEDSLAFVVSQDGGIKAIMRVGSDLVVWQDINSELFGI